MKAIEDYERITGLTMGRCVRLMNSLHKGPKSAVQIAQELGISTRTAFRYIITLRDSGIEFEKSGFKKSQYSFKKGSCPVCGLAKSI